MTRIQEFNNQEFLKELRERVRNNQLAESNISEAVTEGKKEAWKKEIRAKILQELEKEGKERDELLAKAYAEWANDPNERNNEEDAWADE
jgi:flagellar biosynthesis chaperone FliJ